MCNSGGRRLSVTKEVMPAFWGQPYPAGVNEFCPYYILFVVGSISPLVLVLGLVAQVNGA